MKELTNHLKDCIRAGLPYVLIIIILIAFIPAIMVILLLILRIIIPILALSYLIGRLIKWILKPTKKANGGKKNDTQKLRRGTRRNRKKS